MLAECHERIRSFIALAIRLGETKDVQTAAVKDAAHNIRRYFEEALPLHVQDEDESVLPRLRGHDQELDEHLRQMTEEHRTHEPLIASLLSTCRILEASPERHSEICEQLLKTASALERELEVHLRQEEEHVLPAIERWTSAEERAQMVAELRERRKIR